MALVTIGDLDIFLLDDAVVCSLTGYSEKSFPLDAKLSKRKGKKLGQATCGTVFGNGKLLRSW